MPSHNEAFLSALLSISSKPTDDQWNLFLKIVEQFQPFNKGYLQSIEAFDELHNELINLMLTNNKNCCPSLDMRQYKMFDNLMMNFRKNMEGVIIQNSMVLAELHVVKEEMNDLKTMVYEKEFKRLSFSISSPIKDTLVKYFRKKKIQKDPLDQFLIKALLNNDWYYSGISEDQFNEVIDLYKRLCQDIQILNYKDVISIMHYRHQMNVDEHGIFHNYIKCCTTSNQKPNFMDLLNELNLIPLKKYKKDEMKILEQVFAFYIEKNKYR